MQKPTKVLLVALVLAGLVFLAGTADTFRLERREAALQTACATENTRQAVADSETRRYPVPRVAQALINADKAGDRQAAIQLAQLIIDEEQPGSKVIVPLPDGTRAVGVPAGTTRAELAERLLRNGMQPPPGWLDDGSRAPTEAAGPWTDYQKKIDLDSSATNTKQAWEKDPLVCDTASLAQNASSGALVGIQAHIVAAHVDTEASRGRTIPAALVVLCIGAMPWLWYALLRRVSELRGALSGKPPYS